MILVDTSVWIDHFRVGDHELVGLLSAGRVSCHPWVVAELALGNLAGRREVLSYLFGLSQVKLASDDEVLDLIDARKLFGRGIGFVDAHLVASVLITPDTLLWTRDKRLATMADELGIAA